MAAEPAVFLPVALPPVVPERAAPLSVVLERAAPVAASSVAVVARRRTAAALAPQRQPPSEPVGAGPKDERWGLVLEALFASTPMAAEREQAEKQGQSRGTAGRGIESLCG